MGIRTSDNTELQPDSQRTRSLRDTAIWFRSVPDQHLDLNEHIFPRGAHTRDNEYDPIFWTLFGGSRGSFLRYLVAVEIRQFSQIKFHYNMPQNSYRVKRLGRKNRELKRPPVRFEIDGPGGEIIETVDISLVTPETLAQEQIYDLDEAGQMRFLKVSLRMPQTTRL